MKKGFTIVELLAVMVLLSIIALITVPVVLKTIDKAENRTLEVSANLYLKAVEKVIVEKNEDLEIIFSPETCKVNDNGNITCDDEEEIIIKTSGDRPNSGEITFEDGFITGASLVFGEQILLMDSNGGFKIKNNKYICNRVTKSTVGNIPEGNYVTGDEYICEVSKGVFYNFFVINKTGDNIYLILSHNIDSKGQLVTLDSISSGETETVFESASDRSAAENFLKNATSSWNNSLILDIVLPAYGWLPNDNNEPHVIANLDNNPNTKLSSSYWTSYYLPQDCIEEVDFCPGNAFIVKYDGSLYYDDANASAGVRPVIKVLKSNIE